MQTVNIEQQLRLSIVAVNIGTCVVKLRDAADHADDPDERRRFRDMAVKLENLRAELVT